MAVLYPDQLVIVDLTAQEITQTTVPEDWQKRYIGGKGLGARYLYDTVDAGVDPLSADNVLLFLIGPLSGYLPGDARFAVITKSPLTGLFLDSYAGGSFVPSFRTAFPESVGLAIHGESESPILLDLRDATPSLVEVPDLVGERIDSVDTTFSDASVVAIGPAGENGVRFASIGVDGGDHHAGRGGAGAVMGTKGMKAILLDRCEKITPPTSTLNTLREQLQERILTSPYGKAYRGSGTLETIDLANELSILPTRGWQQREFQDAGAIGLDAIQHRSSERERPDDPLFGDFRVTTERGNTILRGGTPIALGATLGIDEFDAVATLGTICDQLGLDVISTGNVISLAILASERDIIEESLSFGDADALIGVVHDIAYHSTSLGRTLAKGVDAAAQAFGLTDIAPTVKAMAVPSFDPRGAPALALAYATSDRGACHRRAIPLTAEIYSSRWTPTQTAELTIVEQNRRALAWSLIVDDVMLPGFGDIGVELLAAVEREYSPEELENVGRRTWTLTRLFNVREGVSHTDDSVPSLFITGDTPLAPETFPRMQQRYYELREWDQHGIPSERLLDRLGLLECIDRETPVGGHPLHHTSH